jgi:tetratricopeptide (TPR) repeat protein
MRLRHAAAVALLGASALAGRSALAQAALPISYDAPMPGRSFSADWHMGRARDFRHAGRLDDALVSLDSALQADPDTRGVHTMRALVLAEKHDQAGTLGALRQARAAGDTLAFPAAMQVGTAQYNAASASHKAADYALALETLQLADSLAPNDARRSVPRLLVAATALALANGELGASGAAPACSSIDQARDHMRVATASLTGAAGAPAAQVQRVRGALQVLSVYTELQARQLRCA